MIFFDEQTQIFYLENRTVTYAFALSDGELEHLWFGGRIGHDNIRYQRTLNANSCDAQLPGRFPPNHMSGELPVYGQGDYREPMITYENEDGDLVAELRYSGHRILPQAPIPGMPSTHGGETLEVTMTDAANDVDVILSYTVFPDVDAITRACRIVNRGTRTLHLRRAFSFSFDLPQQGLEALSLYGAWATERIPERTPLHHGVWSIDSKRVSSSATLNPFMALLSGDTTETNGDAWGINLVYSSSFRLFAESTQNGRTRVGGGISDFCFGWKLAPGELFATPEAVLVYTDRGLGEMSRIFHDTYREHLILPKFAKTPRPVVINNWEATYFNFDRDKLFAIIDAAAGTGIDTFVLDDGWFGLRNDDRHGLGDWFVNTDKLTGGLKTIIDRCHEKGLQFGLWFEPEMVNPDSDLYRAHPDWAIHVPGRTPTSARNQYVLDLTRQEVRDYIVKSVSDILDTHDIAYVKWDYNRNVTEMFSIALPPDRQREYAHRYALGLYDICERLIFGHPSVFFEGCSSGGARFDPAMLYYFPQIWTSDNTDAVVRTRVQYGTSFCYPLSSMSCHTSVCPNHQTGRITPLATRAAISHLGATGYELDISRMAKEELDEIPAQVAAYHAMEHLVLEGDLYRLVSPYEKNFFAFSLVSKDKGEVHITLTCLLRLYNCEPLFLRLAGLDPDAVYQNTETGESFTGATLMRVGLCPPVAKMRDFETVIYHFRKIN